MAYRLAIFDMDGTILDTLADLAAAINHSLDHFHLPRRRLEEVRSFLGNGSARLVELAVPPGTPAQVKADLLAYYSAYYREHCAEATRPYPGIVELLQELRQHHCLTAVVSNKPHFGVATLCAAHFPGLLDFYCGERPGIRRKPAPDTVLEALRQLGVAPAQAVYIGDSEVDIATAANAGLDCLTVAWGFRSPAQLAAAGAACILPDAAALKTKLLA